LARRHGEKWYIAAINADDAPYSFSLDTKLLGIDPATLMMYSGGNNPVLTTPKVKKGKISVTISKNDGVVFVTK
jgi:hypothetical protein